LHAQRERVSGNATRFCHGAEEPVNHRAELTSRHYRDFEIAGVTIRLGSDLPIGQIRFGAAIQPFEAKEAGNDVVTLKHVFNLPDFNGKDLGALLYDNPPWQVYRKDSSFIYVGVTKAGRLTRRHRVAVFDADYSHGVIYSPAREEARIRREGFPNLTLFATDQILIAQLLARRRACLLHAAGVVLNNRGLLFVGHSGARKSTTVTQLRGQAEILCDDRIVARRWPEGFRIHGTWCHGDVPDVSAGSAGLDAVFFLEQSRENRLVPIEDKQVTTRRLLACLIRPLATKEWWEKSLELAQEIVAEATCYEMRFDDSGKIVPRLKEIAHGIR
jgi:hypothetical protein